MPRDWTQMTEDELEDAKQRLFTRLRDAYDGFGKLSSAQLETGFGCQGSGRCCKIGLELSWLECEHIARQLEEEIGDDQVLRDMWIGKLKGALMDRAWDRSVGYGDFMCAFYHKGCTIYPFRPGVCRMYGPLMPVDDECPRERLPGGAPHVYYGKDADNLVQRFYRAVDEYGDLTGDDSSIYMPAGVLTFLLDDDELAELKRETPRKFWRKTFGYRTQFKPQRTTTRKLAKVEEETREKGGAGPFVFLNARPCDTVRDPAEGLAPRGRA